MGHDVAAEPSGVSDDERAGDGGAEDERSGHERAGVGAAGPLRRRLPDVLGVVWTVAAAVVVLLPALRPGISLGPFDLLSRFGLTSQAGVTVHNSVQADQIQQFVPWTDLAWHQVRSGHLPLWNPYNVLGMPLAFNWQSGVFSVPALVSYLFPLRYAYAVVVLIKIIAAGTGVYALSRLVGLGAMAAAFGGTAFELSGPMIDHAGWPHTAVTCWAGWILAAVVALLLGRRRFASVTVLALAVAFAVYGGHPESLVVSAVSVVLFVLVYLVARSVTGGGALARPVRDIVVGAVCGVGLSAPLLFPGVQLALGSSRRSATGAPAFPLSHAANLLASGFQGGDFKTAAYVGVVVLALAVVALRTAWTRPHVPALAVVVVVTGLLTFFSPLDGLLHRLPGAKTVAWSRAVMLLALALAVLAAVGIEALVAAARRAGGGGGGTGRLAVGWAAGAFGVLGLMVLGLEVAAQVGLASAVSRHQSSLVWPAVQAVVGGGVTWGWWWSLRPSAARPAHAAPRPARLWKAVPALLLALETGFLLERGHPQLVGELHRTSPPRPPSPRCSRPWGRRSWATGAAARLQFNTASKAEVGIRPNANIGYGVHEMTVYDPIVPFDYYHAWYALMGQHSLPSLAALGIFCPRINTVTEARVFGVQYVLEPIGRLGPRGSVFVRNVPGESLWSIPGSAPATASPVPAGRGPSHHGVGIAARPHHHRSVVGAADGGRDGAEHRAAAPHRRARVARQHRRQAPHPRAVGERCHARGAGAGGQPCHRAALLARRLQRRPGGGGGGGAEPGGVRPGPGRGARPATAGGPRSVSAPGADGLDVVVVAYGPADSLAACLAALGRGPEVVVVDNASSPAAAAVARDHGARYLDPGANLGFAAAVNLALEHRSAAGRHHRDVLLLNPDARIGPGALAGLRAVLEAHADVACAAPAQHAPGSDVVMRARWPWHTPAGAWARPSASPGAAWPRRATSWGVRCCSCGGRPSTTWAASTSASSSTARTRTGAPCRAPGLDRALLPRHRRRARGRGHRRRSQPGAAAPARRHRALRPQVVRAGGVGAVPCRHARGAGAAHGAARRHPPPQRRGAGPHLPRGTRPRRRRAGAVPERLSAP